MAARIAEVVQRHVSAVALEGPEVCLPGPEGQIPYPPWMRAQGCGNIALSAAARTDVMKKDEELCKFLAEQLHPCLTEAFADGPFPTPYHDLDRGFNPEDPNFVRFVRRAQGVFQESLVYMAQNAWDERCRLQREKALARKRKAEEVMSPEKKSKFDATSNVTGGSKSTSSGSGGNMQQK